jgi:hypothetical protein
MLPPVADQVEPVRLDGQVEDPFLLPVSVSPDSLGASIVRRPHSKVSDPSTAARSTAFLPTVTRVPFHVP